MVAKGATSSRPAQPLTAQPTVRPNAGARSLRRSVMTSLVARWAMRVERGESAVAADHAASSPSASTSLRCAPGPREAPCLAVQPWWSNALRIFAAWAIGPIALFREFGDPQRAILAGENRLRDRDRRSRPRKSVLRALLVGWLRGFADHDQPAGPDDASLPGFIGPVGATLPQPLDRARGEAPCEQDGVLRPPLADRAGHPPDILRPALAGPLHLDLDRPAIGSADR